MATPKFNDAELKDILKEVAEDLQKAFDSEKESLAKGFPPEGSASPEASASEGSGSAPEASASEGSGSDMPEGSADMGSASDEGAPGAEGAPGEGGDPAAEAGAELTPEALQAEYAKLDPQELEMHIHAALAAKEALMGADGAAGAPPMAPPAADGLAMKGEMEAELSHEVSMSPSQHNRTEKGEMSESGGELSHEVSKSPSQHNRDVHKSAPMTPEKVKAMAKAEVAEVLAELKAELKAAHEDVENLTKAVTTIMEKPLRKSITSVRPTAADEAKKDISNLTMQDVQKHLIKLTARPDLKKSDRELINNFYDRRAKITDLAHLFEDYK